MRDLRYRRTRDSMSLGILLIGMGVVFMLMTIGVLPHHALRSWWPVFVVVAGLGSLAAARHPRAVGSAVTTMGIGAWMLVATNNWYGLDWSRSWPLVLVAVGLGSVTGAVVGLWWRTDEGGKEDGHVG